ncbi:hypothetical protein MTP99_013620 [Tenebrio molitor]|nr:hypothetical protein MTP99_013620 [Tenebrio molitor]CAH1372120.1 unnamed protein product [Tenebrio molitor]
MIKTAAIVLIVLVLSRCESRFPNPPQDGYDFCFHPEIGYISPGEQVSLPGCSLATCHTQGNLHSVPCPLMHSDDKNCHEVVGDDSKPYPECCPKISCNKP